MVRPHKVNLVRLLCSDIGEFSEGTMDLLIPVGADLMLGWMVPLLTHTEADRLFGWQAGVILS